MTPGCVRFNDGSTLVLLESGYVFAHNDFVFVGAHTMTLREWRTLVTNRVFKSSPVVFFEIASSAKWAFYPTLVRYAPKVAIFVHEPESTGVFWAALSPGAIVVDG